MIQNTIVRSGLAGAVSMLLTLVATPAGAADAKVPAFLQAAVGSPSRPPADTARDDDRRPGETMAFAGVKPGDKVLELIPMGNYYTRLLSKAVGPKGTVYAVMFPVQAGPPRPAAAPAAPAAGAAPAAPPAPPAPPPRGPIGSSVDLARAPEFHNVVPYNMITVGDAGVSAPELVDIVWTSDNYHDFYNPGFGVKMGLPAFNKTVFDALKPGGVYLILDHASAPGTGSTLTGTLHRIDPEQVKKDVMAAGFELDGDSTALAKPGDDRTQRIFGNRGKVDDFVLRFRKPKSAKAVHVPDSEMKPYFGNTLVLGTPDQRFGTVFFNPDHSVADFGAAGVTYGTWWLDAQANLCYYHQSASGTNEVGTMCTPNPFSTAKGSKVGDTSSVAPGNRGGALLAGYVYPNVTPPPPPAPAAAPAAPAMPGMPAMPAAPATPAMPAAPPRN